MSNRINFTKSAIEALPLPIHGKRVNYYDTKIPKLALRLTSAGTRTYYVIKRVDGEMAWLKLGTYPEITPEQARREADKALGAFAQGKNPVEAKRVLKGEKTLDGLFDEYLTRHAKPNKRSWEDDVQRYNQYVKKLLGKKKLSQITRPQIAALHSSITLDGHSTVANRVLALISSIFSKGIEWGFLDNNPAKSISKNKEKSRDRFLQSDELPRFFKSLAEEQSHTIRDYFLIALLTGARRANVLAMRWADINFDRAEWRIVETKNGNPQTIPLGPELLEILRNRKPPVLSSVFVFPGDGQTGHLQEPFKGWKRIFDRDELSQLTQRIVESGNTLNKNESDSLKQKLDKAKLLVAKLKLNTDNTRIQDLRIHDLRRTLGSWQAKTGASLAIIGKSLNHQNASTTAIYARLDLDPVRDSVNTATNAMLVAAGLKSSADVVRFNHKKV